MRAARNYMYRAIFPGSAGKGAQARDAGSDARTLKRSNASSPADAGEVIGRERYSGPMKSFLPMFTPQWRRIEYVAAQWKYTFGVTYSSRYCRPG